MTQTTISNAVAIVDLGKTRAKVSVFSEQGDVLAALDAPSGQFTSAPGTLNIESIGEWCDSALITLYRQFPFAHLIPVTHGATAVILDADNSPWPVRDYEALIDAEISARYDTARPSFIETGSPGLPIGLNLGRQIYAQQYENPERFAQAKALLTYPQYWVWRWCGALGSDASSLGCHTDLWNPLAGTWSSLAIHYGWDRKFPPLVNAGAVATTIDKNFARRLDINGGADAIQVHWGIHDSNSALAAFIGSEEPFTLLSTGTWLIAFGVGTTATALDATRDTLWNVDVQGRPVASARFMAGREREAVAAALPAASAKTLHHLLQTDNTLVLPAFAPGGPFPNLTGRLSGDCGLSDNSRAALASLYLALMIDTVLDLIGSAGALIIEGPLAKDEAALAALAALRPQQTVKATTANCVAYGAVRLTLGIDHLAVPSTRTIALNNELIAPLKARRDLWRRRIHEIPQ